MSMARSFRKFWLDREHPPMKPIIPARFSAALCIPLGTLFLAISDPQPDKPTAKAETRFIDLSLLVGPEYPCTWPTFPVFQINPYLRIGRLGPYNSDTLFLD